MRRVGRVEGWQSIMASFSVKSFERKLKEMSSRQDSVQTVSLWLIHHRAHSKTVVNFWLDCMKRAKPDRRLLLFYLANDVIQNSRKKGKEFSQSFSKVLGDSMQYLRDTSIRPSVERVLKIWLERKVFDKEIVQKLITDLNQVTKSQPKAQPKSQPKSQPKFQPKSQPKTQPEPVPFVNEDSEEKEKKKKPKRPVPANFKVTKVTNAIATMQSIEDESERRQTLVKQMRLDASSSEGIKQLKDYAGGNRFSLEFEESSTKYEDLVKSLEIESQHRQVLVNLLEDSDAYYEAALNEATIIANAYRSFGNRLHSMKKKLDNKIRKFATAEKEAPVSAPKASFLASGLSGILEEMNRSPAGTPPSSNQEGNVDEKETKGEEEISKSEKGEDVLNDGADVMEEKIVDPSVDHVEVSDMDIESDSENETAVSEPPNSTSHVAEDSSNGSITPITTMSSIVTPVSNPVVTPMVTPDVTPVVTPVVTPMVTPVVTTSSTAAVTSVQDTKIVASVCAETPVAQSSSQQFGYTLTANSHEELGTTSPASVESAPSPEGSPELNLEVYDGHVAKNTSTSGDIDVTTNQSFLGGLSNVQIPGNPGTADKPPTQQTINFLAQLISKQRRQGVGDGSGSNTPVQEEADDAGKSFGNSLLVDPSSEGVDAQLDPSIQFDPGLASQLGNPSVMQPFAASGGFREVGTKIDSGPSTDEEGAGDNTPEYGLESSVIGQTAPIIIRPNASFRGRPAHPSVLSRDSFQGRAFENRPPFASPPVRMERFPNEHGVFVRDGSRRLSMEEQLLEERHMRQIRSPGLTSPQMRPPPMEWEQRQPFPTRGEMLPVNDMALSRDPRIRRREQLQMVGGPGDGPPFIDRVPPGEEMGRRSIEAHEGASSMERREMLMGERAVPSGDLRLNRELDLRNRAEVGRGGRRFSSERDGPFLGREREGFVVMERGESHPRGEIGQELHFLEGAGPVRMEQERPFIRGRGDLHPPPFGLREAPHFELRGGPHRFPRGSVHPAERTHQHFVDRGQPRAIDDTVGEVGDNAFHPRETREGTELLVTDAVQKREDFRGEVEIGGPSAERNPVSEHVTGELETAPVHGENVGFTDNNAAEVSSEIMEGQEQMHQPAKPYPVDGAMLLQNSAEMIPGRRSSGPGSSQNLYEFDFRPGVRPMEARRGMRPISGPFGPHHERPGRFYGPRNFRPRNFRPRHESVGGRPRFTPRHTYGHSRPRMFSEPGLKRPGPPFYAETAKRPHF